MVKNRAVTTIRNKVDTLPKVTIPSWGMWTILDYYSEH